jgi:hypothetical protein
MNKIDAIELIERNPSINRLTKSGDINTLDRYYQHVTGKKIKDKSCSSCVLEALDAVRVHYGYAPTKRKASKNLTKERLKVCYTCPYRVENGFLNSFDTCGPFANTIKREPVKTDEGIELCGCVIRGKAELSVKLIKRLGGCPDNRWQGII